MPWNGSGVFNLVYDWISDAANGINILATRMMAQEQDIATGLETCITRDGQNSPTANLPMAAYVHTNVGNATTRTQYSATGQVQDGKINWAVAGGTADAITASYAIPFDSLVDGQLCAFRATATNATTTPTFSPMGLTARTIVKNGGSAVAAGDIVSGGEYVMRYLLASTRWELLNPSGAGGGSFTGPVIVNLAAAGVAFSARTTDAGANPAAFEFYHNSASPANNDLNGQITFYGNDSGGNLTRYAQIYSYISNVTNGAEAGGFVVQAQVAGVDTNLMLLAGGAAFGAPTGSVPATVGHVNAVALFQQNVAVATLGANTFTGSQVVASTDAGASAGPFLDLYRDSASPAASDVLGILRYLGEDSAGNQQVYGSIYGAITSATSTTEAGTLTFTTVQGGTDSARAVLGAGLAMAGTTDQGAGTINGTGFYRTNKPIDGAKAWAMVTVSGGTPSIASSFGVSSISDDGAGLFTVNLTTAMATANYAFSGSAQRSSSNNDALVSQQLSVAKTTTTCPIATVIGGSTGDPTQFDVIIFGN